jgi:membrane fusion protein, heavy metal efflux system
MQLPILKKQLARHFHLQQEAHMINKHSIFLSLSFAAALSLVSGGCSKTADPPASTGPQPKAISLSAEQRDKVDIETLARSTFRRSVDTTGTVAFNSDRSTQVIAPMSGPVSRLLANIGDKVKAGTPLATISSPDFAAAVGAYRKSVAAAQNARHIADLDQKLYESGGTSRREWEQAQTDAIAAEADRDAALQQLHALGADNQMLEDIRQNRAVSGGQATIRAPISGLVVERLITPGQLVQAGSTPAFTIADMSSVWVMANIFETDLSSVQTGDPADIVTSAASEILHGKVDYIAAIVDPTTRAISVRILTPNPNEILKKDMYVRVTIHSQKETAGFLVPVSAILRDDENLPFVFVENSDHSFGRRRITTGIRSGDQQEITGGLKEGERFVSEGGLFLQFAQSQ